MSALIPGKPALIEPGVRRVLGLNPGMMTGPGTNTYLVGENELTVIDPGPADPRHADNLQAAAEELGVPIRRVLVTHTHRDHSPGASVLAERLDLELLGPEVPDDGLQDEHWQAHRILGDGDRVTVDGRPLRAIATPGHVGNHLCFLLEDSGLLFTGDHLIHGSTVVIAPPSGSMKDYLASLRRLLDEDIRCMAPGHGELIQEPETALNWTIEHRLERERKVLDALRQRPDSTAKDLVEPVYVDVPDYLHAVATLSLEAHLIKLYEEDRAEYRDGYYRALA